MGSLHPLHPSHPPHPPSTPPHAGEAGGWVGADLRGRDLSGRDLRDRELSGADLRGARLVGADLRGAVLHGANLSEAELLGARLDGAHLDHAVAKRAGLGRATLSGASLFGADLEQATLSEARLAGADLRTAVLRDARLVGADLSDARLERADLRGVHVENADVTRARLDEVDLRSATVRGLHGYESASFLRADLRDVDFSGAYLFRRFALDQNYLAELRARSRLHAALYWVWWLTSDCGRSLARWSAWTLGIAVGYGLAFEAVGIRGEAPSTWLTPYYFSVVTLTTLGYGDVLPATPTGQALVMAEVCTGYLMLGGLLSIFANKMARRAD
jgi:uncharacterized protein YjbI with pentapeptide repeats